MKRLLIAALCATPFAAQAEFNFHPMGPNLTYGVNNASQSAFTSTSNPATSATALEGEEETRFRMGIIGIGGGYEVGDVDNFADDLDRLIDKTSSLTAQEISDIQTSAPGNLLDEFNNDVLPAAAEDGYVSVTTSASLFTPLVIASDSLNGAITVDLNVAANVHLSLLNDNVAITEADHVTPPDYSGDEVLSAGDSVLLIEGGSIAGLSVGYSRQLQSSDAGTLYAGAKLKMLQAELGRTTVLIDDTDDVDTAMDEYDQNTVETNATTVDLGLLWVTENYRLGATIMNATSPTFDYPQVSINCASFATPTQQARCNDALGSDEFELKAQGRLEASVYSSSKAWLVNASYDTNKSETPAGDEVQWGVVSVAYAPESWWIPSIRAGLRSNMAGSELSYWTFGLTLFKGLTLDLAMSTDETEIDGDKLPRGAAANLAFETRF